MIRVELAKELQERWEKHVQDWENCRRCVLGERAIKHVLGRGKLPCDVLFVGEAPGNTENEVGLPFVGDSGHLLNTMIYTSVQRLKQDYRFFVCNPVACRPCDEADGDFRQPNQVELVLCEPRFKELMFIAKPNVIVTLGRVAANYCKGLEDQIPVRLIALHHPSYLLRQGGWVSSIAQKQFTKLVEFLKHALANPRR